MSGMPAPDALVLSWVGPQLLVAAVATRRGERWLAKVFTGPRRIRLLNEPLRAGAGSAMARVASVLLARLLILLSPPSFRRPPFSYSAQT